MELQSSSSSASQYIPSFWDYLHLLLLRPILAILFAFLFILVGWLLAWKLVLVHVPLVQEIFGLRKKKKKETRKPPTRSLSRYYNSINAQKDDLNW